MVMMSVHTILNTTMIPRLVTDVLLFLLRRVHHDQPTPTRQPGPPRRRTWRALHIGNRGQPPPAIYHQYQLLPPGPDAAPSLSSAPSTGPTNVLGRSPKKWRREETKARSSTVTTRQYTETREERERERERNEGMTHGAYSGRIRRNRGT